MLLLGKENNLKLYGQNLWFLIHQFAFGPYIPFKFFMYSLKELIPCPICRNHYNENIKNLPIKIYTTKENSFLWTYILHNSVNKSKQKISPNYNAMYNKYKNIYKNQKVDILGSLFFSYFTLSADIITAQQLENFKVYLTASYQLIKNKQAKELLHFELIKTNYLSIDNREFLFKSLYESYKNIYTKLNRSYYPFRTVINFFT
jgi:hypothetical protein